MCNNILLTWPYHGYLNLSDLLFCKGHKMHMQARMQTYIHGSNFPMILSLIYGREFCPIFLLSHYIQKRACITRPISFF